MADDNEEERLRSAALQNSRSILLARRRAEEELVRAKEALEARTAELGHSLAMIRATLLSIGDAVITTDAQSRVTSMNPVAEELTGWAEVDARGEQLNTVFTILDESSREPVESPATRALREGRIVGLANHTILVRKPGDERSIDDSAAPIRDDDGNVLGVVLVFRDVTEQRGRQEELQRNARENAELLLALRESDQRKDEFLAMLAHELRNPLAPIANATQFVRALPSSSNEVTWAMNVIERQVHQMTRLVDDLLDVSRISKGRIELRRERLEVMTLVNMAVEACSPLLRDRGHELRLDVPSESIVLDVDPTRMTQVMLNLLTNAAKYMNPGGGIDLSVRCDGDRVEIKVRDNGIGISPDMLAGIFEMFSQEERSLEHSRGGLGIGLTLARRLVEMHGGEIEARSDGRDRGSEFTVLLPLAAALEPSMLAPPDAPPALLPSVSQRILVVDDNRDAAESLARLLSLLGHEVEVAHDGIAAIEAVPRFAPDLLLLDLGMPRLDGYQAARRIRAMEDGHRVFLVALTGWGQEEDRRRSHEAGFDEHLTKPVEMAALQQILVRSRACGSARVPRKG